ncbi:MAG: replication and repair protein RecF [Patescibacteria group bacterium]|nr:replication and repair protein RecF [Patescibacteria group bacterium]
MITNLRLQQFRSYQDSTFDFKEGVNIIAGPNASGKTNILEAILFSTQGKSYRAKDIELIKDGMDWARLDTIFGGKPRTVKIIKDGQTSKKSFDIEGKKHTRLSYKTTIPVVMFEPNHLLMLSGSPELRRAFLDALIEQTDSAHTTVVNNYKRALLQRNRLIKNRGQSMKNQLFVWDIRLSELGAQLVTARHKIIDQINQQLSHTYSNLAGATSELTASYSNPTEPEAYASYLLKRLEKDLELDCLRGYTGAGPHREDIVFSLNARPLAVSASRGEARTTLLALKTIELNMIENTRATKPILLLDDVFSELDGLRRQSLTAFITTHQTFITTTDADIAKRRAGHDTNLIKLPTTKE